MNRLLVPTFFSAALLASVALAQGATPDAPAEPQAYPGVTPSTGSPPAERRVRSARTRLLTWPGFEARPNGASRFFVQLSQTVQWQTRAADGRFVVTLPGTRTHLRNSRRPLETRFFNTPVTRAKVERRGRHDLAIVFEMRAQATPRVYLEPGPNGYTFLFVEFPEGNWLPAELQQQVPEPEAAPPPRWDQRPDDPSIERMDEERPPGFGD